MLPNETSSRKVKALQINNTVQHCIDSILEAFKHIRRSVNTVFNYYAHVIQSDYSNLVYVCELSIIAILKATLVSEPACLDKLSHFKGWRKSFIQTYQRFM